MQKLIFLFLVFILLSACNNNKKTVATQTTITLEFFKKTKITPNDIAALIKEFPEQLPDSIALPIANPKSVYGNTKTNTHIAVYYHADANKKPGAIEYFVGKKRIIAQEYYKNGQAIITVGTLPDGTRDGYTYNYNEDGSIRRKTYYKNGVKIEESIE